MTTVIAAYGYLGADVDIGGWGADHVIASPHDLLALVGV